jgi:sporulation protein YlmC with PRC-barrel domain
MKNVKVTSLICGGILSLTGSSLLAQQSSTTDPSSSRATSGVGSSSQSSSTQGSSSQSGSTLGSSSSLGSSSGAYGASSSSMHSGRDVRLSQIMNQSVRSQDGKTLGNIQDVLVDPQTGRIQFAILSLSSAGGASDTSTSGRETVPSSRSSVSGTPGSSSYSTMTGKLIPVPWQLLSQGLNSSSSVAGSSTSSTSSSTLGSSSSMGTPNLVLNLDESKLRSAPSFDASDWNQLQGGSLDQRIYSHFGVDRSSAYGTSGSSISGGAGSSSDRSGQGSSSQGSSSQGSSSSPDRNSSSSTSPQGSSSSSGTIK